jgi:predicted DNA-binding protein with PD1-like motif
MRKLIPILGILAIMSVATAQTMRTEPTKPATTADVSKAVTNAVPDVYALNGQFDRVVLLRFKSQADLLDGLERMIKEQQIRNGVILSAIGSVRSWHYHTISKPGSSSKDVFVKNPEVPADILSMNGYVIDGRVHAHFTMADLEKAFGGHLEAGTTVHSFAVVTVGVLKDGIDLNRIDDKTYR